jgi:hypothetical protein
VNEIRTGATYHRNSYFPDAIGSNLIQQFGIQGVTTTGIHNIPILNIDPVTSIDFDGACDNYYNNPSSTFEWTDNLSWTRGRHFPKFGVDVVRERLDEKIISSQVYGEFDFTGVFTNFGYADFLLGIPQTTELAVPTPPRYLRGTTMGVYAQDQFKVSRDLTLNYGLRWQLEKPYHHIFGAIYSFDPKTGALVIPDDGVSHVNPYFPSNIPVITASKAGYPADALIDTRKANFQPRFGFAYKPFGSQNTVIRGGYGIYSNLVFRPLGRNMNGGPFAGNATYINSITNGVPLFSFPDPFLASPTSNTVPPGSENVQGKNPHIKMPYTQQWNLTAEREVRQVSFRASYVGTRSVNLIYRRNLNQLPPSTTRFSASNRPYPLYNQIIWSENGGNEFYGGLELAATRKYSQNLSFSGGWTWARDLTDTQDQGFGGQVIQNQFDRRAERANNSLTTAQRAFAYAVYTLPFGRNQRFLSNTNRWVNGVLGGWNTGWNVNLQTGQYFTPRFSGFDPSNTASFGGRPDRIADGNLPGGQRTINRWFDASAFKIPGCPDSDRLCKQTARTNVGRFGNTGTNVLAGPGVRNLDFSLMKYFHLRENMRLQFRLIMVNAFNHPNFAVPRNNISSGTVGTIASMARVLNGEPAPREIDLGLRLEF